MLHWRLNEFAHKLRNILCVCVYMYTHIHTDKIASFFFLLIQQHDTN